MSLIIKGMEMPQAGDVIVCGQIEGKLQCTIVTRNKPTKWCEASEVSTPHGRLIDCESESFPIAFRHELTDYAKGWNACLRSVLSLPTVIEAEVGE
jgi:hypothetical protein